MVSAPITPQRITDDLDRLLEVLPHGVQASLASEASREQLLEVVLDLGRVPEARYPGRAVALGEAVVERADLEAVVERLGSFGGDNRAGIERTLHRISAIRNRTGTIVGLTCRVGRAVFGTVAMVRDLMDSGQSLLLMGRPGVGKTTALREIARVLADELGKRVVVIDDSIVRGTTSRKLVQALRDAGATEVHMRISSPPVTHPCFYGIDTDTQDQLIAARLTLDEIAAHLGVDSLAYLSKQGMVDAAKANSNNFCSACFDGAYPIEVEEAVRSSKLMLEPAGIAATL